MRDRHHKGQYFTHHFRAITQCKNMFIAGLQQLIDHNTAIYLQSGFSRQLRTRIQSDRRQYDIRIDFHIA